MRLETSARCGLAFLAVVVAGGVYMPEAKARLVRIPVHTEEFKVEVHDSRGQLILAQLPVALEWGGTEPQESISLSTQGPTDLLDAHLIRGQSVRLSARSENEKLVLELSGETSRLPWSGKCSHVLVVDSPTQLDVVSFYCGNEGKKNSFRVTLTRLDDLEQQAAMGADVSDQSEKALAESIHSSVESFPRIENLETSGAK
jgi:hypothetical protein